MALPAIRNIDAFPIQHEGHPYFCLRDPTGYIEEQVMLSPVAFFIATCLNGRNELTDIQHIFAQAASGRIIAIEDMEKVITFLDERGFLWTERFAKIKKEVEENFKKLASRPAYLSGKSYPDDPDQLRKFLDSFFAKEGGPNEKPKPVPQNKKTHLPLLIAPHIDFDRGGHSYAHSYLKLSKQTKPETVFIFGVAHAAPPYPFVLTKKKFETPFGTLETDVDIVTQLEKACVWDPYEFEIVHRAEHSIEFQTVMLSYLYGPDVHIVPILCGFFSPDNEPVDPTERPEIADFLGVCQEIIKKSKKPVTVIAAADLAHVGKRFGDPFEIDDNVIKKVETRDREDLEHVTQFNADKFYESVMKDQNERRVCGLNCIYSALKTVDHLPLKSELLHYGYAPDPQGGIVSFASLAFE